MTNMISAIEKLSTKHLMMLVALLAATLFLFGAFSENDPSAFTSSEVKFTDASHSGLSIVPASCPSSPHYAGECGAATVCPEGTVLQGTTCISATCPIGFVTSRRGCVQIICPAGYTLSGNRCLPPPPMEYVPFTGTAVGGGAVTFSGQLDVRPRLVRSGDATRVYWNVSNAAGCTVTGTNGDSWSVSSSGTSGQLSRPIVRQTVFRLTCSGLLGAVPASITQSATVNIIPVFNES